MIVLHSLGTMRGRRKQIAESPLDVVVHSPKLLLTSQIGLRATS